MLTKIIAIKNVGRFRNSAATPNPQLAKHTFITGANGFGKTTMCAVFRSLHTGDANHIIGRKTLGVTDGISVELLYGTTPIRFDGANWSAPQPTFAIFDGVFVGENVHAGEIVDVAQKRNLYRIIVGEAGVRLAAEDADLTAESRVKTTEITASTRGLQPHLAPGMSLDDFLGLPPADDVDALLDAKQAAVQTLKQADALAKRAALAELPVPAFPNALEELLLKTIDDIAADAEAQLQRHLAGHEMSGEGENWISAGIGYAGDDCPFCGQSIKGLPLVSAFKAVFSEQYKNLQTKIEAAQGTISRQLGEAALANQATIAERNRASAEFWRTYVTFDWSKTELPQEFATASNNLCLRTLALLSVKGRAPLEKVPLDNDFKDAVAAYEQALAKLVQANADITQANVLVTAAKQPPQAGALASAESELARLEATKSRHSPIVVPLCQAHMDMVELKNEIDEQREDVRNRLNAHTNAVVRPYQTRINTLLDTFNAAFSIAETSHAYPGGVATSSYQLVINGRQIDVGSSRTPTGQPSFKNTLSAGDRTTLALAFFIAHLEADAALADKTVVFDDPFTSQDKFRRGQTVHEIMRLARSCKQIVVLSHDASFLKLLWDKAPPAERVSLTLADHREQGSKLLRIDLDRATRGRTATDIDDLQTFRTTGAGGLLDIVRKMRVVLETYCRTTFSGSFADDDWLGDMVGKIRAGGATHPAAALYDELDQINDYSKEYHHGENMQDATPDDIDSTALTGYVRRTLKIVNALEA